MVGHAYGKSAWSQGPKHGATTKNVEKYIDFAAAHHIPGVLVEGWNYGWDGDWVANGDKFSFTKPYPDYDIDAIVKYAAARGVEIIGHHETGGELLSTKINWILHLLFYGHMVSMQLKPAM